MFQYVIYESVCVYINGSRSSLILLTFDRVCIFHTSTPYSNHHKWIPAKYKKKSLNHCHLYRLCVCVGFFINKSLPSYYCNCNSKLLQTEYILQNIIYNTVIIHFNAHVRFTFDNLINYYTSIINAPIVHLSPVC